jgi:hypothetical protein
MHIAQSVMAGPIGPTQKTPLFARLEDAASHETAFSARVMRGAPQARSPVRDAGSMIAGKTDAIIRASLRYNDGKDTFCRPHAFGLPPIGTGPT